MARFTNSLRKSKPSFGANKILSGFTEKKHSVTL